MTMTTGNGISTTGGSTVIPLRPEEVPEDLICSICLSIPLELSLLRCGHVFCQGCIEQSANHQIAASGIAVAVCPVCRVEFGAEDPKPLAKTQEAHLCLVFRIWSKIQVKCEHHDSGCTWTGSLSDYKDKHRESCPKITSSSNSNMVIAQLQNRIEEQDKEIQSLRDEMEEQKTREGNLYMEYNRICAQRSELESQFRILKSTVNNQLESPYENGRGGYSYDRHTVVRLTKLVCQNLENKPHTINSNKLFEHIKSICNDLNRNYSDNPKHLYIDVRMLLGVCLASTWFSDNQMTQFRAMARENNCFSS